MTVAQGSTSTDLEKEKFVDNAAGETCVRTIVTDFEIENAEINVDIASDQLTSFTSGIKTVTTSATLLAIGGSNAVGRNQMTFQPRSYAKSRHK